MDVYDKAIDIEIRGEKFYREIAAKAQSKGISSIFKMLADDEVEHRQTFEKMKENQPQQGTESVIEEKSAPIFKKLKKEDFEQESVQIDVYKKALEIEDQSIEYYQQLKEQQSDSQIKAILDRIIDEEKRHHNLVDNMIEHVARPEEWVEHAMFGRTETY
jgi:rubrerythrin